MTEDTQKGTVLAEVSIKYARSAYCRVVHADGAWGGITPQGLVQMAVYSEKHEIPDAATFEVMGQPGSPTGSLKQKQVIGGGHVREIEVEIIMTPAVARAMQEWLVEKLTRIETQIQRGDAS